MYSGQGGFRQWWVNVIARSIDHAGLEMILLPAGDQRQYIYIERKRERPFFDFFYGRRPTQQLLRKLFEGFSMYNFRYL